MYIVWNNSRTEGFITSDEQVAYEARKGNDSNCFSAEGERSDLAVTFCETYGDEDCSVEEIKMTLLTLGVGDGTGNLFVQGDYESIKACQNKLLELEKYRNLFLAAKSYIDKSSKCSEDYSDKTEAWERLQMLMEKYDES